MEHRATVEDLMYAAVLEKFLSLGVDMLGNMDNIMEKVMSRVTWSCAEHGCVAISLSCCSATNTSGTKL